MHPVKDIGISPSPVDMVELGADAYTHRKQVGVKQLYNQVPQTTWVQSQSVVDKMPNWKLAADRRLGPSVPHSWAAQPRWERSAARVRRTLGQYVAVCLHLQPSSHTQPTSTLLNKVWEAYFYKEEFTHSLKFVYYVDYSCIFICLVVCGYTTKRFHHDFQLSEDEISQTFLIS